MATATKTKARTTATSAKQTARQAERTAKQAQVTAQGYLREAGYAALGVGDATVALVRAAGRAPARAKDLPRTLERTFWTLSDRGRQLSGRIEREPEVQAAADAARSATRRVKAAGTSVRKAAEAQADAVEEVAERVGSPSRAELEDLTVDELQARAGELEISGRSAMTKDELIKAIQKAR